MKTRIKAIFLAILGCCIAGEMQAQNPFAAPDLASYQIKGEVSSVKIETFKAKGTAKSYTVGEQKNSRPPRMLIFNAQGQLTAQKTFDLAMPDMVMSHIAYSYNADGKLLEIAQIEPEKNIIQAFVYDSEGNIVSLAYDNGNPAKSSSFSHNIENGKKVITTISKDEKGRVVAEKKIFNPQGLVEEEQVSSQEATNNQTTRYKYDSQNRLIEMQRFDYNQKPLGGTKFEYNAQNCIAEVLTSSADLATATKLNFIYKYDEKGNWIEQAEVEKGFVYTVMRRTLVYKKD